MNRRGGGKTFKAAVLGGFLILFTAAGCGPEHRVDLLYITRQDDTIARISGRYFGKTGLAEEIAKYNKKEPDDPLPAGTRVRIPFSVIKKAKADFGLIRRLNEGRIYASRGDYDEARAAFEEIIHKAPTDPAAAYELGLVNILDGTPERAIPELERARALGPADTEILLALATARANAGDPDGAVAALAEALAQDPDCDYALYALGIIYAETGQYEKARHYLLALLLRDSTSAVAERARRLLKEITEAETFGAGTEIPVNGGSDD